MVKLSLPTRDRKRDGERECVCARARARACMCACLPARARSRFSAQHTVRGQYEPGLQRCRLGRPSSAGISRASFEAHSGG